MVTENVDEERPEEEETCLGVCSEMKQRLGNHKQEGLQEGQALLKVGDQRVEENMDLPQGGQNHGIQSNLLLMLALPLGEVFDKANPLT